MLFIAPDVTQDTSQSVPDQGTVSDTVSNQASQPSAQATNPPSTPITANSQNNAPAPSGGGSGSSMVAPQPNSQAGTASSPGTQGNGIQTATNNPSQHPLVKKAGVARQIAMALSGDPTVLTANPDGTMTRKPADIPTSRLWMGVVLSAIAGGLSGLSEHGPGAIGRAAEDGLIQGENTVRQRQQLADQQSRADAEQRAKALTQQANLAEIASRTILNTAESEARGADTLTKYADQNRDLIQSYDDAGQLLQRHMTQQELMTGLQNKSIDPFAQLGPVDGFVLTGDGRVEATHALISNPNVKVPLTQDMADKYIAAHLPGWNSGMKVPDGFQIQGTILARANEQFQSLQLAQQRHDEVTDALRKSDSPQVRAMADKIPTINSLLADPQKGSGLFASLQKFQAFISHNDVMNSGHDLYTALQAMNAPSMPDPANKGKFIPNPNQPYAARIAMAYSPNGDDAATGFRILKAYHDEIAQHTIKDDSAANDILANPDSSPKEKRQAKTFLQLSIQQKAAVARAGRAQAEGTIPGNASLISPNPVNGVNVAYLQSLPAAQQAIVKAIGEGRQESPNTRTKEGQALSQMVNNAYPGYDGTRYHTYQAMQKDFVSGKSSQGLLALNTALSHLQTVFDSANLGSTLPGISNLERLGGNKAAVSLKAASTAVADELGRAYKSGVVTAGERDEWLKLLSGSTPANAKENAVAFAHLLDGKLSSYEQTLRNGAPSAAVRLPALMSPQAAQAYQHMTGEVPQTSVGTNQQAAQPSASAFSKITADGKMGWNGQTWVTLPTQNGGK